MSKQRPCEIADCDGRHYARGWCRKHYRSWARNGDPLYVRPIPDPAADTKRCNSCKEELNLSAFAKGQGACRTCRLRYSINNYSRGLMCGDCGVPVTNKSTKLLCRKCHGISRRGLSVGRSINYQGYALLSGLWGHPNASYRGQVLEHVKVMSEMLGRGLLPGENVHHINGVRDDNRPENLELWSTSQPAGQRVADKVEWAKDLLALYAPEALVEPQLRFVEEVAA